MSLQPTGFEVIGESGDDAVGLDGLHREHANCPVRRGPTPAVEVGVEVFVCKSGGVDRHTLHRTELTREHEWKLATGIVEDRGIGGAAEATHREDAVLAPVARVRLDTIEHRASARVLRALIGRQPHLETLNTCGDEPKHGWPEI